MMKIELDKIELRIHRIRNNPYLQAVPEILDILEEIVTEMKRIELEHYADGK